MSPYATAAALAARENARTVAEAAAPNDAAVDRELLLAVINDEDVKDRPAQDVAAARAAVRKITDILARASATMDGYLRGRYPELVARSHPDNAQLLERLCLDLAAFDLVADEDAESPRRKRHADAMRTLERIARGEVALATHASGDGDSGARAWSAQAQFSREALAGL